jgi:hypothetical protein
LQQLHENATSASLWPIPKKIQPAHQLVGQQVRRPGRVERDAYGFGMAA